ncbi:MAG: N-acetyltransferase family protein [Gaiellaceae bacterium]
MSEPARVCAVDASSVEALRPRLCEILIDSVRHGASVGFLAPLDAVQADVYWLRVERAVAEGRCLLLAAGLADGTVAGTVQLDVDTLPNQPHRATVSKLLVHSDERRRGVGEALMVGLERVALEAGRWLLTLDTATAAAVRLYERMGWTLSGVIPRYALNPDGSLTQTSFFWKELAAGLPSGLEPITAPAGAPRPM